MQASFNWIFILNRIGIIARSSTDYGYDLNGNLTSDGASTFSYDLENRLTGATGGKNAVITYDPLGRIFQTGGGAAGTTTFLYDGDALVEVRRPLSGSRES
jgi:uncharacterized protein RhaS with RHS repeats